MLREIRGGRSLAIKAMRFAEGDFIGPFLDKYDSLPIRDRQSLSFEAIALAAQINIRHLWGEIMLAIREHSVNAVKIIAVAAHPDVVRRRVEYAQTPGGYRDRDALDTMLGALPSPKGPTFINKFFAGSTQDPEAEKEAPEELVDDLDFVFPDASEMQERVQPMRQKLLEARK